jgi:hypothetical protein
VNDSLAFARKAASAIDVDASFAQSLAHIGQCAWAILQDDRQILRHDPPPLAMLWIAKPA